MKYLVTFNILYSGDIEIESENEEEAKRKAWEHEKDVDYFPIMGTIEQSDIDIIKE